MFGNEVDYRLAKWLLLNMEKDGIITEDEMHIAWMNITISACSLILGIKMNSDSNNPLRFRF